MESTEIVFLRQRPHPETRQLIGEIRRTMRPWGITVTFLAMQLGVSRQYIWQVLHRQTFVSPEKLLEIKSVLDQTIENQKHARTFGERLRAARVSAGLTLKQAAEMIGYTWVAVERWEKNICLPKPGVLWHLRSLYGVGEEWLPPEVSQKQIAYLSRKD